MFKRMVYIGVGLKDGNSVIYLKLNLARTISLFSFSWSLLAGIVVNAKVATSSEGSRINSTSTKHRNGTQESKSNLKTYFGEITISGDNSVINVSPDQWTVNGLPYNWRPAQTITVHRTKLVTDGTGKMIALMFPHKITLLIVRHMRTERQLEMGKIHFLGFYIVDDRGFSWYTHGLLGKHTACFVRLYSVDN